MKTQQGAVLVIALIMLLALTLLGTTAVQTTVMQERMAGNVLDRTQAFQHSESLARSTEADLKRAGVTATAAALKHPPAALVRRLMQGDCSALRFVGDPELASYWNTIESTSPDGQNRPQRVLLMPVPEPGGASGGPLAPMCIPMGEEIANSANAAGGGGGQYARLGNFFWVVAHARSPSDTAGVTVQTLYLQGAN